VIAPCTAHIPVAHEPARVRIIRNGQTVTSKRGLYLQSGDQIRVPRPTSFTFSYAGNRYRVSVGLAELGCRNRTLTVELRFGSAVVRAGSDARTASMSTREAVASATAPGTTFIVERNQRARSTLALTRDHPIVVAKRADPSLQINTPVTYTAISDRRGLRLDIWPFSISPLQRRTTPADGLPAFWADGRPCSVGCTAAGAIPGWPLQPFDQQHAIRAGINELRTSNFHVAVDIEAHNSQPVYAIQSGRASIRYMGTGDVNVDVGRFYYWHIHPTVANGQYVTAYRTVIGNVLGGFYHVALSEGTTSDYLNPLRPGGSLRPYADTDPPVIGLPQIFADGRVIVGSFDPQSFVATGFPYETPVLAPSSLAWRLYDAHNHALTGLEWAMRGSQNYPPNLKPVIFAPGAANPGFDCFFTQRRCIPNWVYWLAGGLTKPLPLSGLRAGRYRLSIYSWDWAGNTSALDYTFKVPLAHPASATTPEFGPLNAVFDYDETGAPIAPPAQ